MKNKKEIFFGLLTSLLMMLALEGAARLFYDESYLEKIRAVLRDDAELLWTHRPGLDTVFEGVPLRTNSLGFRGGEPGPKRTKRIVVMGASPSFGWGVEESVAYPALLAGELAAAGVGAEVLNASVIGYSSWQGARLLERQVLALEPDVVVFAYGVNDVDRYRFFRSLPLPDAGLPAGNRFNSSVSNLLARSSFVKAYSRLLNKIFSRAPSSCPPSPPERADLGAFIANLETFHRASIKHGFKLVVMTAPFYKPGSYFKVSCGSDSLRLPETVTRESLKRFVTENGACPASLRCAASFGLEGADLTRLSAAAELYGAYDAILEYNDALRKYASGKRDLRLLDAGGLLKGPDMFLKPDHDLVHFSSKGHQVLSRRLAALVREII